MPGDIASKELVAKDPVVGVGELDADLAL